MGTARDGRRRRQQADGGRIQGHVPAYLERTTGTIVVPKPRKNFAFQPDEKSPVREFTDKDLSDLHRLLADSRSLDAYCRSYLYYALTGRGQVWSIGDDEAKIICTTHPNTPGNLLVFFPFAYNA